LVGIAMKTNKVIELCARGGAAKRFSQSWKKHQCNKLFPTGVSKRCTNQANFLLRLYVRLVIKSKAIVHLLLKEIKLFEKFKSEQGQLHYFSVNELQ
jgi:hypothetical protein